MEQYEGSLDRTILEEMPIEIAREYLSGKYGLEFAEKTVKLLVTDNPQNYANKKKIPFRDGSHRSQGLV